jgi:ketosteroid isomerase-like protein
VWFTGGLTSVEWGEPMSGRSVVERYAQAIGSDDFDAQDALVHEDYVLDYPQSGEVIRGRSNRRAVHEGYPGRTESGIRPSVRHISGTTDQFVATPSWPGWSVAQVVGAGDDFTLTGTIAYTRNDVWHFVVLLTVRDGRIWRETAYFAAPFAPADWRRPYVESPQPN